ncbi:MAG TPA: tryptophan synthase subunit alpha [Alloiococcus sp.]|nr:tryptophan synthase subunit alpha [Alloiococcus sp.]
MSKTKLESILKNKVANDENLFIPYIMAGDGGLDALKEQILFLESCGVSAIELGIPFSDPVADGPTIQEAGLRSLNAGTTLKGVLDTLQSFIDERNVPIILMTYINPIFNYGVETFAKDCKASGVSGVIIPDVPFEEEAFLLNPLQSNDIAFIRLAALTSTKERLKKIAKQSEGFLYAVSVTGTTGKRAEHQERVYKYLANLKEQSNVPVLAGFGISDANQAQKMNESCDGVIVGSAIVDLLHQKKYDEIKSFIQASL